MKIPRLVATWAVLCSIGCNGTTEDKPLTRQELLNPESCKDCHPKHYTEWAGSMHAYASKDPVFLAMNARGQQEAQLGDFCVKCHAPMAVREGATTDGLNLAQVPEHLQGVTCYFCHNAVGITGEHHNNSLELANDDIMRGGIFDPVRPSAHRVLGSKFHDRNAVESSLLCGACHDIVTPKGVHLERTLEEYKQSIFSQPGSGGFDTCQGCHMIPEKGSVAAKYPGVPSRAVHEHIFAGVDVALTDFPNREAMRAAVEECALPNSILLTPSSFDVDTGQIGEYKITLETQAGHAQPSGASQDRRMWLEVVAYDAADRVTYSNGTIADDAPETFNVGTADEVWTFHDRIFNEQAEEVHMFWDAAPSQLYPKGYDTRHLPQPQTAAMGGHSVSRTYQLGIVLPSRVDIRVRMRPMALEVLQDLVQTGHLDAAIMSEIPTFTVASATVQWTSADPRDFVLTSTTNANCDRYLCLLRAVPGENCASL